MSTPPRCDLCEDVAYMLDTGEHPDRIALRVGLQLKSLDSHLRKCHRTPLARRLSAAARPTATAGRR